MGSAVTIDLEDPQAYLRPRLRVYLACSLTSDEDRPLKDAILTTAERVFTEAGFDVHNPARHTPPGSPHTAAEVYLNDLSHTVNADFIFFLRLGRSHGMGIEAQLAADVLLPWADARAHDSYTLSPLLAGLSSAPAQFLVTIPADDPDQFAHRLAAFLMDRERIQRLATARRARESAHAVVGAAALGRHLRASRLAYGLSAGHLGELADLDPAWIEAVETDPRLAAKLTLVQLARWSDALGLNFAPAAGGTSTALPRPSPAAAVPGSLIDAALEFADYSLRHGPTATQQPRTDETLLGHWQEWVGGRGLSTVDRPVIDPPASDAPIRVYVCPPLSNVREAEARLRDTQIADITAALTGSRVPVQIETPAYQRTQREDHGPEIYLRRLARLRQTDLAIVLLDPPSTGVGVMLQLFHNATIPVLCVTANWAGVSRMVRGLAPARCSYLETSATEQIGPAIKAWVDEHAGQVRQSRARREQAWGRVDGLGIRRAAGLTRIARGQAPKMPCVREEFLCQLIDGQETAGLLTLLQLAHVASEQQWRLVPSATQFLGLEPSLTALPTGLLNRPDVATAVADSLAALWDALTALGPAADEDRARREWLKYLDELSFTAARGGRRRRAGPRRSQSDWVRVLRAKGGL